ncbi:MAG: glycosyltransferase [candidate division SR1 bacterium]|nr:glycosyltransferase [candidate division SR1 bacterium]
MKKSDLRAFLAGKIPFTIWMHIQAVLLKKQLIIWRRGAFEGLKNIEGLGERDIKQISSEGRRKGISGFARLRDSALYLEKVIEAHLPYLNEIVLVDNNSQDNTWEICESLQTKYPEKIKIFQYLPEVYRLGTDEYQTCPENSVHDMSYYYNWTLSQTSCQYAMKIDDDHLPLPKEFAQIRYEVLQGKYENKFLALGLYNIKQGESGIELDLQHPLAGIYGDFGIFPVSELTYFVKDKRCENFIHRLKRKRGGLALFHLKFWQEGFGTRNYRGNLKSEHEKKGTESIVLNEELNQIFESFNIEK